MAKGKWLKGIGIILGSIVLLGGVVGGVFYKIALDPADLQIDLTKTNLEVDYDKWENMTIEKLVTRISEQVETTWSQSELVWPGIDFTNHQLLFPIATDTGYAEYAYLIDIQREVKKVPYQEVEQFYNESVGSPFFKSGSNHLNDIPTMSMEISEKYVEEAGIESKGEFKALPESALYYMMPTHEEFHNMQTGWKGTRIFLFDKRIDQYNALPDIYEIRQIRLEIINHLRQAILQPENETMHLNAAKWWWDNYISKYPDIHESARESDVLEGTARYFDMAMNVRSQYGMNAPKEQIYEAYQRLTALDYKMDTEDYSAVDFLADSYPLGGFAGVLLEKQGREGWQEEIMNEGTTPTEILLRDYQGEQQEPDPEIIALLDQMYSEIK